MALADRYSLPRLLPLAAQKVLLDWIGSYYSELKTAATRLDGMGLSTGMWQLLCEALVKTVKTIAAYKDISACSLASCMPDFACWTKPGDFF